MAPNAGLASPSAGNEEGAGAPEAPQSLREEELDFDPGAEEPLEAEGPPAAPIPGGDENDDTEGALLETEPDERRGEAEQPAPPVAPAPPPAAPAPPAPPEPAPVDPPPAAPPTPPAAPRSGLPLRERPPLLTAPIPIRPPERAEPGGLPQAVGGQQPSPPPDSTVSLPAPRGPLSPEVPDVATRAEPSPASAGRQSARVAGAEVHVVRAGESLWSIAEELAGPSASNAEVARAVARLWDLNAERIGTGDPDLVMAGTQLLVPRR